MPTLSPTLRTTVTRETHRAVAERARLLALLGDALLAHLGAVIDRDDVVTTRSCCRWRSPSTRTDRTPTAPSTCTARPAPAGCAPRSATDVCVTITELDGLVAARSGMEHSMNYRSAVIIGRARTVDDPAERARALDLIVDHMIPGRAATLRAPTRKELAATAVLALPLREASMKERAGGPRRRGGRHRRRRLGRAHPAAAGRAAAGQRAGLPHRRAARRVLSRPGARVITPPEGDLQPPPPPHPRTIGGETTVAGPLR